MLRWYVSQHPPASSSSLILQYPLPSSLAQACLLGAGLALALATDKASDTGIQSISHGCQMSPGSQWLVGSHCWLERLIRKEDGHMNCFLTSGGQLMQDRFFGLLEEMTYPEGPCKHTCSHVWWALLSNPQPRLLMKEGHVTGIILFNFLVSTIPSHWRKTCLKVNSNSGWQMHLYYGCGPENTKRVSI